jgi:hypothetical protein
MKKYRTLILIAGLTVLLLSQYKLVMPFVYKVVSSDLFLVESDDQASQHPISTPLSNIAFTHCNNYIKAELGPDAVIAFPDKPLNAWTLGNHQYLISAEVNISGNTPNVGVKKYACRINYNNGDNEEGAIDIDNWSVVGVSGLDI